MFTQEQLDVLKDLCRANADIGHTIVLWVKVKCTHPKISRSWLLESIHHGDFEDFINSYIDGEYYYQDKRFSTKRNGPTTRTFRVNISQIESVSLEILSDGVKTDVGEFIVHPDLSTINVPKGERIIDQLEQSWIVEEEMMSVYLIC